MSDDALQEFLVLKQQLAEDERVYQQALGSYKHAKRLTKEQFGTSDVDALVRKVKVMDKSLVKQQRIFANNLKRFKQKYNRHVQ
jgi:hypothetical protein